MVDGITVPEEYSLDDLMFAAPDVTVILKGKEKKFWIRPPIDTEKAMAQNAARQKSRQLRAVLEDTATEEYQLLIKAEMENMNLDQMRLVWLTSHLFQKTFEMNRLSLDNRDEYFVSAPEGKEEGVIPPTNEDMDRYEQAVHDQEAERLKDLEVQSNLLFNDLKGESEKMDESMISGTIEPLLVEQQVSREWSAQYGLQILFRCTFSDPDLAQRSFKSVEDAMRLQNTPGGRKVLESLLAAHNGLMLDADRVKN